MMSFDFESLRRFLLEFNLSPQERPPLFFGNIFFTSPFENTKQINLLMASNGEMKA